MQGCGLFWESLLTIFRHVATWVSMVAGRRTQGCARTTSCGAGPVRHNLQYILYDSVPPLSPLKVHEDCQGERAGGRRPHTAGAQAALGLAAWAAAAACPLHARWVLCVAVLLHFRMAPFPAPLSLRISTAGHRRHLCAVQAPRRTQVGGLPCRMHAATCCALGPGRSRWAAALGIRSRARLQLCWSQPAASSQCG